MIENYRLVANLCSVSKIFEKLIVKKINELEIINGISVGGKQQHGFMKNKSTVAAGLILQSLIARAPQGIVCIFVKNLTPLWQVYKGFPY